jgi:hypothetical protein
MNDSEEMEKKKKIEYYFALAVQVYVVRLDLQFFTDLFEYLLCLRVTFIFAPSSRSYLKYFQE